jgi:tetratricopeptide (TPR) repeat protein
MEPDARALFCALSLLPGPDFGVDAAAALIGSMPAETRRLLARLSSGHLLERTSGGRFAFHDLLRLYAARRSQLEDDPASRDAATRRMLRWYLATAHEAVLLVLPATCRIPVEIAPALPGPPFTDADEAMAWVEAERASLVPVVRLAAERPADRRDPPAWLFVDVLRGFYFFSRHTADWLAASQLGLAAAVESAEPLGEAAAEVSLAQAYRCVSAYSAAQDHADRAIELCRQVGWREGESTALNELAGVRFEQGGLRDGIDLLERAIALDRAIGHRELEAIHQMNVAMAYWHLGVLPLAAERLERILDVAAGTGDGGSPQRRALVLSNLTEVYWWQGRLAAAEERLTQALAIHAEIRYPAGLLAAHAVLTGLCGDLGRPAEAISHAETVVGLAKDVGSRRMEGHSFTLLADAERRLGHVADAVGHAQQAVRIHTEGASPLELVDGLLVLGAGQLRLGESAAALDAAEQALRIAQEQGARAYEGKATTLLAAIQHRRGDLAAADQLARAALAIHTETGHRPGAARTLRLLADLAEQSGRRDDAAAYRRDAHAIVAETGLCDLDPA